MQTLVARTKGMLIVSAIASIILGIVFLAEPVLSGVTFCYFLAALFVIGGIARFVMCLGNSENNGGSLVGAILMLLIGLMCFARPDIIASFITVMTGMFIACDGAVGISAGVACKRANMSGGVLIIVMSVILMICGIYLMFAPFGFIMIMAGISLIIDGIFSLIFVGKFGQAVHDAKVTTIQK